MSGEEAGGFNNTKKSELGDKSTEQGWKSELAQREQEAWNNDVLGARVDVAPLPDYVTPELQKNLEKLGFGKIIYMPKLDLKTVKYLRKVGVDQYLKELEQKYPKWKPLESLSKEQRKDHTVPRNLQKSYWRNVKDGYIVFPVLPGQWMAVETVDKPSFGEEYERTPFAERLGFPNDRATASWNRVHDAIEREKRGILEDIGFSGRPVDIRQFEALERNLAGNRFGWDKTKSYGHEWTNTEYRESSDPHRYRLTVGEYFKGGAGNVNLGYSDGAAPTVGGGLGFRAVVVLNSSYRLNRWFI